MTSLPPNPYGVVPPFPPPPDASPTGNPGPPETGRPGAEMPLSNKGPAGVSTPAPPPSVPPLLPVYRPPLPSMPAPPGAYGYPPGWYPGYATTWPPVRRTSALTAAVGWAMLGLGVLVVMAAFLPWGHVHLANGTTCRVRGVDDGNCGSRIADYDLGVLTITLSIPVLVLGLLRGCIRRSGMALGAAISCVVLGLLVTLVSAVGPTGPDGMPSGASFSASYGIWLTFTLGLALVGIGIWGIIKRN